jgi:hypothetical protein
MIHLLGSCLIILSAVFASASALLYGVRFPWWRHSDGWHLFSYMAVIGVALMLWAGRVIGTGQVRAVPEAGVWPFLRLAVFVAITIVLGWRFLIIVKAWREQRHEPDEKQEVS